MVLHARIHAARATWRDDRRAAWSISETVKAIASAEAGRVFRMPHASGGLSQALGAFAAGASLVLVAQSLSPAPAPTTRPPAASQVRGVGGTGVLDFGVGGSRNALAGLPAAREGRGLDPFLGLAPDAQVGPVLARNLIGERRILVTTTNEGFTDFARNWVAAVRHVQIRRFLIVCEDLRSYERLAVLFPGHVLRTANAPSGVRAAAYGSGLYNEIVSARPRLLLNLALAGLDVVFSDADVVFARDPLPGLDAGGYDIAAQLDLLPSYFCTGFMRLVPTPIVARMLAAWTHLLETRPSTNQVPFNRLAELYGVKIAALDPASYCSGQQYFLIHNCTRPITIHNNFVVGVRNKIRRFKAHGLWFLPEDSDAPDGAHGSHDVNGRVADAPRRARGGEGAPDPPHASQRAARRPRRDNTTLWGQSALGGE